MFTIFVFFIYAFLLINLNQFLRITKKNIQKYFRLFLTYNHKTFNDIKDINKIYIIK